MNDLLRRYLDGELDLADLPPDIRDEARAWDALVMDARTALPGNARPGMEERVMAAVQRAEASSPAWRRAAVWLVRPRAVRVSPLAGLAAAAVLAAVLLLPRDRGGDPAPPVAASSPAVVYVEFRLDAPDAASVYLVGDFNAWTPTVRLEDREGNGIWSARVPLDPGIHKYMFLIDGSRWVTDPSAERHVDDGFGNRNAVLAVAPPSRGT